MAIKIHKTYRYEGGECRALNDPVSTEAPLNIILRYGPLDKRARMRLAVTMRTPGEDALLAMGFLFTEGIISRKEDVLDSSLIRRDKADNTDEKSILIDLNPDIKIGKEDMERHIFAYSSCGLCGKTSSDNICNSFDYDIDGNRPVMTSAFISGLKERLDNHEGAFQKTGSMHAAMVVNTEHSAYSIFYEDVGRHNALDKLIGHSLLNDLLPMTSHVLILSGRISFELVQKAGRVGIPTILALGAPSTAAITLAEERGMTLIGFLKSNSFNVYCGGQRIASEY